MRFHSTTNYKNENNIKCFYIENSPRIRRDCSVRSFCCYVVCRVIMGFEQKLSKKFYFKSLCKITCQPSHFWILPSAKLAVRAAKNTIVGSSLIIIFVCILLLKHHTHLIHAAFWVLLHLMFMSTQSNNRQTISQGILTNNQDKINETFKRTMAWSSCSSWKPSSKARTASDFLTFLRIQQG